jgi:hypothetical protein
MKALVYAISMTVGAAVGASALPARSADAGGCATPPPAAMSYPTFCSIPQPPKNVRTAAQFKAAVVDARLTGRGQARSAQSARWSLTPGEAEAFAAEARALAAPPPPVTGPGGDTEDFARRAREDATPPPRPH